MADKLATVMTRKIISRLQVALGTGVSDNERMEAFKAILKELAKAGVSGNDFVVLLTTQQQQQFDEAEAQQLFDAGREFERGEQAKRRRQSENAPATVAPADNVGDGVNGYSWREIAGFCLDRKHRLRDDREVGFVEGIARKLANPFFKPSEPQANWLHDIFLRFGGRI